MNKQDDALWESVDGQSGLVIFEKKGLGLISYLKKNVLIYIMPPIFVIVYKILFSMYVAETIRRMRYFVITKGTVVVPWETVTQSLNVLLQEPSEMNGRIFSEIVSFTIFQ